MNDPAERAFLTSQRSHDYRDLMRRWRAVARPAGLRVQRFASDGGFDLFHISPSKPRDSAAIYLSAGIHGDEPGAPAGLIRWAEANPSALAELDLTIFPCLNPWGLTHNSRTNHRGRDLNRDFQNARIHFVRCWRRAVGERSFDLALNLHEDYDAQGVYVYELSHRAPRLAEPVLEATGPLIPADRRSRIDISRAKDGIIRRRISLDDFSEIGLPEAVFLHFYHSERTLTVETPSEFSLLHRAAAQQRAIEAAIEAVLPL